ncbi:unnamed protein product [Ostreobium quekettii]|uniref:Ionotropic glutamate receptor C-terminal domain-containing protein n=1 Tax=Ostreobium quekettii TaxID=121088 RepID=A0A8S1IMS3_9CHLO|nr:unnamed protein product [Ostreobium quekettii]|eukprot:evm.model.scf_1.13 EVM.evm.TU.scf_1.13   scf_1:256955-261334(+)
MARIGLFGPGRSSLMIRNQLIWVAVWSLAAWRVASQEWNATHFTVCASLFPPMAICEPGADPDTFTGHDVEQMRIVASRLGWSREDYTFKCFGAFSDVLDDLVKESGSECSVAASGVTRSTVRQEAGMQFTYPTYRASLGIMVRAHVRKGSYWGFLNPLHWSVWLAISLTALLVPWLVFVIESIACHGFVHPGDWTRGLKNTTWDSLIALVNFGHFRVQSTAARVVVMGYGLIVLIMIQTYVANLAAFLTVTQVDTSISKEEDLYGQRVATVNVYGPMLRRQGFVPVVIQSDDNLLDNLVHRLRASHYKAVLMDEPWVLNTTSNQSNCDLQMLSETTVPFDYAFALPRSAPREFVDKISTVLLEMQEDLTSSRLVEQFIQSGNSSCPRGDGFSDTQSVRVSQIAGLWIILAFCIACAFVILVGYIIRRIPRALADAKAVEGFKMKQGLSLGRMRRIPTTYHPNASALLCCSQQCCAPQIADLRATVEVLTEAIRWLGDPSRRPSGNGGQMTVVSVAESPPCPEGEGCPQPGPNILAQQASGLVAQLDDSAKNSSVASGGDA